jgi:hypothetical protein
MVSHDDTVSMAQHVARKHNLEISSFQMNILV